MKQISDLTRMAGIRKKSRVRKRNKKHFPIPSNDRTRPTRIKRYRIVQLYHDRHIIF